MIRLLAALAVFGMASEVTAFESFDESARSRWLYVQDGVMGGVSEGAARLEGGTLVMRGIVSTANNGGFIQVRQRGFTPWPASAKGLRLETRGNGEIYYVFLRTPDLRDFRFSYRATFTAPADWVTVDIPFSSFQPSNPNMPPQFAPDEVRSIGIVAYGRDHEADLSLRSITLFD